MMKYYWTRYLPVYPKALLYMLQDTEYRLSRYSQWYGRTRDFRKVMKRRSLTMTKKVQLLLLGMWLIFSIAIALIVASMVIAIQSGDYAWAVVAAVLFVLLPFIMAYGITVPLAIGYIFIQKPREKAIISRGVKLLAAHSGLHIAVAGSYGKTTMKEILDAVLSEGKTVAMTPGNMNTAIGISRFATNLSGNEDVLIIELGEEAPGDVARLAKLARPTMGIITGINEAHLVSFGTLEKTVATIFELVDYLGDGGVVYRNGESPLLAAHSKADDPHMFSQQGVDGWKVSGARTSFEGTEFVAKKGGKTITAHTRLVGLHTVGMTAAAIAIADDLGLTPQQIEAGLRKITPFEHRMEPRQLHGAWVIDDTYNGNSEGVRAGLALLKTADATRRIYVTPGLVEQGAKTREVHVAIGRQVAESADVAVLMQNSVTDYIVEGLQQAGYTGETMLIDDPLEFYTNLDQFVAGGDVVLMQNDWTDNYA